MDPRRLIMPVTLFAVTLLQPITAGAADRTPATLDGEILVGATQAVAATCNPDGTSTMTYLTTGKAGSFDSNGNFDATQGPYPGTFTEVGTLTMGPQVVGAGWVQPARVLTWKATFTIKSAAGTVTANASLSAPSGTGLCLVDSNGNLERAAWGNSPPDNYSYTATIKSERLRTTYLDKGGSYAQLFGPYPWSSDPNSYSEALTSWLTSPTPSGR